MNNPLTSRKTEREVRLRLDRLDEVLLRKIIREELEAFWRSKEPPPEPPRYWGGSLGENALGLGAYTNNRTSICGCGRQNYCHTPLTCGLWPNV